MVPDMPHASVSRLSFIVIFAVCVVFGAASRYAMQRRRLVPVFYDLGTCTDKTHHLEVHNITITMDESGANFGSADVIFRRGMKSISKFVIVIHKCTGGKAPSLCEYFARWGWTTAVCQLIPSKGMAWTPFYKAFSPPFDCPIQKGLYYVRNATLDLEAAAVLLPKGFQKHIWPVEIQLFDGSELVACFVGTGEAHFVNGKAVI